MPYKPTPRHSTALSILFAVVLFFFILTFSIGLPIYFRPFYYLHIHAMGLDDYSGYTITQIKNAYDAVLDYLTIPGRPFSTGVMAYSAQGQAHFADCKVLFDLNAAVLLTSTLLLVALSLLRRIGVLAPFRIRGRAASYYSGICAIVIPVVVGTLAALNFDTAFRVFHQIFFPGKDNWLFDPRTDEIIRVLPQEFFMDCAILIGVGLLAFSLKFILCERRRKGQAEQSVNDMGNPI